MDAPIPGGDLYRCLRCHLKFRYPIQAVETYDELYDNTLTSSWSAQVARPDWDRIVAHIQSRFPAGGARVLDFGCYTGGLLGRLPDSFEKHGIEVNRAARAVAKGSHVTVWRSVDEIPVDTRFDVVIAADVIEHMANPLDFVVRLAELLDSNGVLIITTGDADNRLWEFFGANWWYCRFPEHIAFVSRGWLKYLSEASALSVVSCEPFRYCTLSPLRIVADSALMALYGLMPKSYLRLITLVKGVLRRTGDPYIRGIGISRDHLLIVLSPCHR